MAEENEAQQEAQQEQQPERANVEYVHGFWGSEWRCWAGQRDKPIGCERHARHHWCETCEGWYGVPHDGFNDIHRGPNAHPNSSSWSMGCVCRPCLQDPLRLAKRLASSPESEG